MLVSGGLSKEGRKESLVETPTGLQDLELSMRLKNRDIFILTDYLGNQKKVNLKDCQNAHQQYNG